MNYIGMAGWNIPKQSVGDFPKEGSHLERYARVFNCVEINSSFYNDHKPETYERWASMTTSDFRFSVKLSKIISHESKLAPGRTFLRSHITSIMHLEEKLENLLLQTPPKLEFNLVTVVRLFKDIRSIYHGHICIEPRNLSWLQKEAASAYRDFGVSLVLADPDKCSGGASSLYYTGGIAYYRLHGSPVVYRSSYTDGYLEKLTECIDPTKNNMVIFDNTTFGCSVENGLKLMAMLAINK